MILTTCEEDQLELRNYALELIDRREFEGLSILIDVLNDTNFKIKNEEVRHFFLCSAIEKGKLSIVKHLIEYQTNNLNSDYIVIQAIVKGDLDIAKYIIDSYIYNNRFLDYERLLFSATRHNRFEIFKHMVSKLTNKSNVDGWTLFSVACTQTGNAEIAEYIRQTFDFELRQTALNDTLFWSNENCYPECCKYLVSLGASFEP